MMDETINKAIEEGDEVAILRSREVFPPVNHDIALTLYERNPDGSDHPAPFLSMSRPQDFATNEHMKYTRFGVLQSVAKEGKEYVVSWLVHLYWDGSRDEDEAREAILSAAPLAYGIWEPTAPSDPLMQDDFWGDEEAPPNGYWPSAVESGAFVPFDNFERPHYEKVNLGGGDE